jgi:hypothetical protein
MGRLERATPGKGLGLPPSSCQKRGLDWAVPGLGQGPGSIELDAICAVPPVGLQEIRPKDTPQHMAQ